jgi:hypothetical protein
MHYTPERKRELVEKIQSSKPKEKQKILFEHKISDEEFNSWQSRLKTHGLAGLKRDNIQSLRKNSKKKVKS